MSLGARNRPQEVQRLARESGVDVVQFHGSETDDEITAVGLPAIRVEHMPPQASAQDAQGVADRILAKVQGYRAPNTLAVLLDTSVGATKGGTGAVFDWSIAAKLAAPPHALPVLVAGGLTDQNVEEALQAAGPNALGVDASSGLETATKGQKDIARVEAYIRAALGTAPTTANEATDEGMTMVGSTEYYKGFLQSPLNENVTSERGDGLEQAIKLGSSVSVALAALVLAFLESNGLL